jgi:hypothetical protein
MANIYNLTDTWNAGATTFNAIKMNVTDTASAAASKLMDLQVGAASKFNVSKSGVLQLAAGTQLSPASDGVLTLLDAAGTSFARLQLGGTTSSFPAIKRNSTSVEAKLADDSGFANLNAASLRAEASASILFNTRTRLSSPSDGILTLSNNGSTDFTRLNFGGTTSSFPGLRRNGNQIDAILADGSALCSLGASVHHASPGTAIPAGGATNNGFKCTSTSNFGIFFGSGAPSLTAAKGSLYLRSDGSGTTDRAYIATDSAGTWTALTTVA